MDTANKMASADKHSDSSAEPEKTPEPIQDPEKILITQADQLYDSFKTKELYELLLQHKDVKNDEILWRLARAARDLAQLSTTKADMKKTLVYEAFEYAKKALSINQNNFACHKWFAICISDVGDYEGIKQKISNAFIIRDHFLKAIELNPADATSMHLMGLWCFTFAEMPWYQQKIASVLFAKPPESTYNEALTYFMKAENVDPNFYSMNLLMLGKTYLKVNNNKLALLYLTKAVEYPAKTEEDNKAKTEAEELLKKVGK
ncbi:regulator of microtubule dynamics protein 1-like isoform X2 [Ptychodera flava]|uniref:regulator of microtubule dynamics protein 1-like isoform X2 n=1 Tax=Ptychodera flava TaxID=63121 RepID=UPI00396A706F